MTKFRRIPKEQESGSAREHGFSIIEILIAMSILSIGLLALAQMQVLALNKSTEVNRRNRAIVVAQDRIEQVVSTPYEDLDDLAGTDSVTIQDYGTFSVQTTVGADTGVSYRDIAVEVSWTEGDLNKSFRLTMIKSDAED
ncbi:MAG: prepilin-type N-terminal cleavage/methylation domain-containing protein [Desulfatibacillaceae bacterium]